MCRVRETCGANCRMRGHLETKILVRSMVNPKGPAMIRKWVGVLREIIPMDGGPASPAWFGDRLDLAASVVDPHGGQVRGEAGFFGGGTSLENIPGPFRGSGRRMRERRVVQLSDPKTFP